MYLHAIPLVLLVVGWTLATRDCGRCIPLEDLVPPALGILLETSEISLAIAFHNGTTSHLGSIAGSPEYQDLMFRFQKESKGGQLQDPWNNCNRKADSRAEVGFLPKSLILMLERVTPNWLSQYVDFPPRPPAKAQNLSGEDTDALYGTIQALLDLKKSADNSTSRKIGVVIPEWFTDWQACKLFDAVDLTGKSVQSFETYPESAFTAFGYPLCQVDSEWMPCPAPGRIMTLNYALDALTAAMTQTPFGGYTSLKYDTTTAFGHDRLSQKFQGDEEAASQAMVAWIDVVLEKHKPHKVILVGKMTRDPVFQRAVSESKVSALIVPNPAGIELENAVALGAARLTKDKLESYGMDCIEDDECEKIRRKADELSGSSGFTDRAYDFARTEL